MEASLLRKNSNCKNPKMDICHLHGFVKKKNLKLCMQTVRKSTIRKNTSTLAKIYMNSLLLLFYQKFHQLVERYTPSCFVLHLSIFQRVRSKHFICPCQMSKKDDEEQKSLDNAV